MDHDRDTEITRLIREFKASVSQAFDDMDRRFDKMDGRLDKMDGRLDKMDGRLDKMDGRFDKMDERFDRLELNLLSAIGAMSRTMDRRQTRTEDDLEWLTGRVATLERRLGQA